MSNNVSYDLIWQISRNNSSYIVKRYTAGGVQFSREPLNATGIYTQSASGFASRNAVGVVPTAKGIKVITKKNDVTKGTTYKSGKEARQLALAVSKAAAESRDDLLESAVLKASALSRGRKAKKTYAPKRR